jgi:Bacterial regulatory proteins, tetR family
LQVCGRYGLDRQTSICRTADRKALREQGLVRPRPGVGTVVATPAHARPVQTGPVQSGPKPTQSGRAGTAGPPDRERVVHTAVAIADAEGRGGLSMRRLAGELGMPTMSLYRHVSGKEELLLFMLDTVFAGDASPELSPGTDGRRACVEALARLQWSMYRRHPWLAQAISFGRCSPRARWPKRSGRCAPSTGSACNASWTDSRPSWRAETDRGASARRWLPRR